MTTEERDDLILEFGHAVAGRLRRLPRMADRWPKREREGFDLFHDIAEAADAELARLLAAISQLSS
jgi:hypothetical protein